MQKIAVIVILAALGAAFGTLKGFRCQKYGQPPPQTGTCGRERTILNEGVCLCCYVDTVGNMTIGIGFNLIRKDAAAELQRYGLDISLVKMDCLHRTTKHCMTSENAYDLFDRHAYPEFSRYADHYVPGLPKVVRAAVIDVAFAGYGKLLNPQKFPGFREHLRKREFREAAEVLKKTGWCADVKPNRCNSDVQCIGSVCSKTGPCGQAEFDCSSNPECFCMKTTEGYNVCGPNDWCRDFPNCSQCSPKTSVCVKETCCKRNICVPLSKLNKCPAANSSVSLGNRMLFKRPNCLSDSDCQSGKTCDFHTAGKFCS